MPNGRLDVVHGCGRAKVMLDVYAVNFSTIVRVLAATDAELASGVKQVISDEIVSKESEDEAWVILRDILDIELRQTSCSADALRLASQQTPARSKECAHRERLLLALAEARAAVLTAARRSICKYHA